MLSCNNKTVNCISRCFLEGKRNEGELDREPALNPAMPTVVCLAGPRLWPGVPQKEARPWVSVSQTVRSQDPWHQNPWGAY